MKLSLEGWEEVGTLEGVNSTVVVKVDRHKETALDFILLQPLLAVIVVEFSDDDTGSAWMPTYAHGNNATWLDQFMTSGSPYRLLVTLQYNFQWIRLRVTEYVAGKSSVCLYRFV